MYLPTSIKMAETAENTSLSMYVLNLLDQGQNREEIENDLMQKGHEERFVKDLLQETIKLRNAKMRTQGLALILGGALICLVSCVLTISSSVTYNNVPWVLYGLTTVGILVVFAGFVKVF